MGEKAESVKWGGLRDTTAGLAVSRGPGGAASGQSWGPEGAEPSGGGARRGGARTDSRSDTRALPVGGLRVAETSVISQTISRRTLLSRGRGSWVWAEVPSGCSPWASSGRPSGKPTELTDPSCPVNPNAHRSEHFTETISNPSRFPQSLNRHQFDSHSLALFFFFFFLVLFLLFSIIFR